MNDQQSNVICMKWGTLYGSEYVNRLYSMVRRNITGELRFVCLTDDKKGIYSEVECHPCPEVPVPPPHNLRGWRKLSTYASSENLFGLTGDWLFLDLDVVVTGSLDEFFTYRPQNSFIVMQNWTQPGKGIGNTSVYRFHVGAEQYLLNNLIQNQDDIFATYRNSQTYISRTVKKLTFWPDEWCILFKVQCIPPWPQRLWKEPVLSKTARVVAFPGVPNPDHAIHGQWPVSKTWKKLYKHVRPTPWIEEIWRED